jgi:hypothetical protein
MVPDLNEMMKKGQKNWEKVAPVAKPILTQLANTYLQQGSSGGGYGGGGGGGYGGGGGGGGGGRQ